MLTAIFILLLGLAPSFLSVLVMRQADARAQDRLRLAIDSVSARGVRGLRLDPDQHYIEGIGYVIGDITCRFNARSNYVRCAVNPFGPCEGCSHHELR